MLHVILDAQACNEQVAESIRGPARRATIAGNINVDPTIEALSMAADYSTSLSVTQCSTMLGHATPEDGEVLLFENSDIELEYLWRKNTCLDKQCKI
jgi:hypothetical protein